MRRRPTALALSALAAATVLFAGGFSAGHAAAGDGGSEAATPAAYPDWFLPIWDAYDRNPAITPDFDFAQLYSGRP
jgi:hypothetical protein